MTGSSYKNTLKKLVAEVRTEEQALWDSLSDEERNAVGEIDRWAPKDHLAHTAYWTERLVKQLQAATGGEPPSKIDGFQKTNEDVYEANKDRTWKDVLSWAIEVSRQFQRALDAVSEEILEDTAGAEGTGGPPLWQNIAFTGVYHTTHHIADAYLERGDFEGAQSLMERIAEGMTALDKSDAWQGTIQYNLACFFALHDKPRQALSMIKIALQRAPNLIEWSKQDGDLDSLRDLPEFQALLAEGES